MSDNKYFDEKFRNIEHCITRLEGKIDAHDAKTADAIARVGKLETHNIWIVSIITLLLGVIAGQYFVL